MVDYDHSADCDRFGADGSVHRAYVTLIAEGCVPDGKGPFLTERHLDEFVREAISGLPPTTQIIVHRLTWNGELWTECGREMIAIDDALEGVECL